MKGYRHCFRNIILSVKGKFTLASHFYPPLFPTVVPSTPMLHSPLFSSPSSHHPTFSLLSLLLPLPFFFSSSSKLTGEFSPFSWVTTCVRTLWAGSSNFCGWQLRL